MPFYSDGVLVPWVAKEETVAVPPVGRCWEVATT